MRMLKILIALCIMLGFATNNANSQKVIGTQTVYWRFTPAEIPCLTEAVSGDVFELQSFTNKTYHVKPRGVLLGETSGEEYSLDYEYNQFISDVGQTIRFVLPMLLKHDGKLVAEIHYAIRFIYNANGIEVQHIVIDKVNCK